jgi:hypothetical protein
MSCGLQSERHDKPINVSVTPMEILALRWKVSTLRWKASNGSVGKTKALRRKIAPHITTTSQHGRDATPLRVKGIWWDSV